MKRLIAHISLILFFTVLIFLFGIIFSTTQLDEKIITIEKGDNAMQIATTLQNEKIIKNKHFFYYYVLIFGNDKKLDFGSYLFDGKFSMFDVAKKIEDGKVKLRKITIPEGLTLKKTCRLLSKNDFGTYYDFITICNDSVFIQKITNFSHKNIEGFLFPETYHFPENVSEKFIISHLVKSFLRQTKNKKSNENLNFYDTLILASIVEKEARLESENPLIASVYLNRLEDNHKLQADPTVAYILENLGKTRKKIYYKDLEIKSPFNTYLNNGLPPTPICSPSLSSINAVINPQISDYYFFFADGTGGHNFSKTYTEHSRKLQLIRSQNGK
ncbi:MAG: endolytic transglycosylase MltG [Candidatus Cloacimonetes bacterium]|nr:endolytic transglycosylase MltG [Candidatus Cloacimonadota bacterium]